MFVAVESSNGPALELYRRAGFEQVLDESLLPQRRPDATPRLFLRKTLEPVTQ